MKPARRGGRPRKTGDRYPGGKLKPKTAEETAIMAPALWRRIKDHAVGKGLNPLMATEIGRLSLDGTLADAEAMAAMKYAEIVGRFDRLSGVPARSARSPAYERGFGKFSPVDESRDNDESKMARRARRKYLKAVDQFPSSHAREIFERVVLDDLRPRNEHLADIKAMCNRLAISFGFLKRPEIRAHMEPGARPEGAVIALWDRTGETNGASNGAAGAAEATRDDRPCEAGSGPARSTPGTQ